MKNVHIREVIYVICGENSHRHKRREHMDTMPKERLLKSIYNCHPRGRRDIDRHCERQTEAETNLEAYTWKEKERETLIDLVKADRSWNEFTIPFMECKIMFGNENTKGLSSFRRNFALLLNVW
jgi:hypothetical protein